MSDGAEKPMMRVYVHLKNGELFESKLAENYEFSHDSFTDKTLWMFPSWDQSTVMVIPGGNINYITAKNPSK